MANTPRPSNNEPPSAAEIAEAEAEAERKEKQKQEEIQHYLDTKCQDILELKDMVNEYVAYMNNAILDPSLNLITDFKSEQYAKEIAIQEQIEKINDAPDAPTSLYSVDRNFNGMVVNVENFMNHFNIGVGTNNPYAMEKSREAMKLINQYFYSAEIGLSEVGIKL